jgi:hypothetical protein
MHGIFGEQEQIFDIFLFNQRRVLPKHIVRANQQRHKPLCGAGTNLGKLKHGVETLRRKIGAVQNKSVPMDKLF